MINAIVLDVRPFYRPGLAASSRDTSQAAHRDRTLRGTLASCLAIAMLIAGCGNENPAATQLAAKVNKYEISAHQVNQAVARAGAQQGLSAERLAALRLEVLDRLVDQQLAVERAIAQKLDRKPEVMLQIEASRREILVRAYYEQLGGSLPQPEPNEARKYYVENPQLFAQRRIYRLHEIAVGDMGEVGGKADGLRDFAEGRPIGEIEAWLKARVIPYASHVVIRAAEQIPLDVLQQLARFKDGEVGVIEASKALLVMHLIASRPASVEEAAALPAIQRFLVSRRLLDAIEQDKAHLRAQAKIEYLNEFAAHVPQMPPAARPAEAAPAQVTPPHTPAQPSDARATPDAGEATSSAGPSTIGKGIPELK